LVHLALDFEPLPPPAAAPEDPALALAETAPEQAAETP
jgi:hypothetical protein